MKLNKIYYSVELSPGGGVRIRLRGWCYYSPSGCNKGLDHRYVDYRRCFLAPGFGEDEFQSAVSGCGALVFPVDERAAREIVDDMLGFKDCQELPMRSVTQDTPCGNYQDC